MHVTPTKFHLLVLLPRYPHPKIFILASTNECVWPTAIKISSNENIKPFACGSHFRIHFEICVTYRHGFIITCGYHKSKKLDLHYPVTGLILVEVFCMIWFAKWFIFRLVNLLKELLLVEVILIKSSMYGLCKWNCY